MRNIILGYEVYDPETKKGRNFNGRMDLDDINLQVLEKIQPTEAQWFIKPSAFKDVDLPDYHYFGHNIPDMLIKRMCVHDVQDQTYFYPIEIIQIHPFVEYAGRISISNKVRNDVINKKAFIIFRHVHEGDMFRPEFLSKFNNLLLDLNLPKEQVIVFHGDQNIENYKYCPFTYIPTNVFPFWLQHHKRTTLVTYNPKKLFVCYNRIVRPHRVLLLGLLKKESTLDKGLVSLGNASLSQLTNINASLRNLLEEQDLLAILNIAGTSPDNQPLTFDVNPANVIVSSHYEDTFVSLVTETLTETVFFSEKIFKPILMGHPFILVGGKGSLRKLKELGFKTFDHWWDESYDECDDFIDRCIAISKILTSLNNKNNNQLRLIRHFMKPVLKHNQELYNSLITPSPYGADIEIIKYIKGLV